MTSKDESNSESPSFGSSSIFKKPASLQAGLPSSVPEPKQSGSLFGAPSTSGQGSLFGKSPSLETQSEKPIFGQPKSTFGSGSVFGKSPFESAPSSDEKKAIFGEKSKSVFGNSEKSKSISFGSKSKDEEPPANNPFLGAKVCFNNHFSLGPV